MFFLFKIKSALSVYKFILKHCKLEDFFYSILLLKKIIYSSNLNKELNSSPIKIEYKKKYKFNHNDWFCNNIPVWNFIFNKENIYSRKINYLEIGSFEGRSTLFIAENIKNAYINIVDPFLNYDELKNIDSKLTFATFVRNTINFKHKIKINKTTSDIFFNKNKKKFDLIYVDGAHDKKSVRKDAINSFKYLNKNGIIIFDDFLWSYFSKHLYNNPINALLRFLRNNHFKIEILYINYQLIIKKKI